MHHFTTETENVEFYDVAKKLMAVINNLNILTCYKEWRKYQTWRLALIVWWNTIRKCYFYHNSLQKIIIYVTM